MRMGGKQSEESKGNNTVNSWNKREGKKPKTKRKGKSKHKENKTKQNSRNHQSS
jgi:hypothetical protein